jgi:hypothetical protein
VHNTAILCLCVGKYFPLTSPQFHMPNQGTFILSHLPLTLSNCSFILLHLPQLTIITTSITFSLSIPVHLKVPHYFENRSHNNLCRTLTLLNLLRCLIQKNKIMRLDQSTKQSILQNVLQHTKVDQTILFLVRYFLCKGPLSVHRLFSAKITFTILWYELLARLTKWQFYPSVT